MNLKIREDYLKTKWIPYPEPPGEIKEISEVQDGSGDRRRVWVLGGRLEQLTEADGDQLGILCQNNHRLLTLFSDKLEMEGSEVRAMDVLQSGDLVCMLGGWKEKGFAVEKVQLLVPCLGESLQLGMSIFESQCWQEFLQLIRQFFTDQEFIEVETPYLIPAPSGEAHLQDFSTNWQYGSKQQMFYLPTSPEFHLKKALSAGWDKIFEIKTCFRNNELSDHHQPEFRMLEWYRAYQKPAAIKKDLKDLIQFFVNNGWSQKAQNLVIEQTTVAQLFLKILNFDLKPNTTLEEMQQLATLLEITFKDEDDWDEVFFQIFLKKIEPYLSDGRAIMVGDFPPSQAALARIKESGWADRFEFYWQGFEIANAFNELNDPVEQQRRLKEEQLRRQKLGFPATPIDTGLIQALKYGMPPSSGIALGLDRLFMAFQGNKEISSTRLFPLGAPSA